MKLWESAEIGGSVANLPGTKTVQPVVKCYRPLPSYHGGVQLNTSPLDPEPILEDRANEIGRRDLVALSQLAALQGHVLSYRELKRLLQGLNQQSLQGVPLSSRLAALWCARFPQSKVGVPHWPPKPEDAPALWICHTKNIVISKTLVVIGVRENGGLAYLSHEREVRVLPPEQARMGYLLVLDVRSLKPTRNSDGDKKCHSSITSHKSPKKSASSFKISRLLVSTLKKWLLKRR